MRRIGYIVYLLVLCIACNHAPSENKEAMEDANKSGVEVVDTTVFTDTVGLHRLDTEGLLDLNYETTAYGFEGRGWYKRLEGTIGGSPVTVHLVKRGRLDAPSDTLPNVVIGGYYYYNKYQKPIAIYQYHPDPDETDMQGRLILYDNFSDTSIYQWWLTYQEGDTGFYQGTWYDVNNGKDLDIYLEEKFPGGSERLQAYWLADIETNVLNNDSRSWAMTNLNMLMPDIYGDGLHADLAYGIIWRIIPIFANADLAERAGSAEEVMRGLHEQFFGAHKEELNILTASPDRIKSSFMNRQMSVVWNDDLHLCLAVTQLESINGARANLQTRFLNINLQDWYGIFLDDILENGYEPLLESLIKREAQKMFEANPNSDTAEAEQAGITENYAITNKGIWFSFEPFHFSSYGPIEVKLFVAFEKIEAYVKPYWLSLSQK